MESIIEFANKLSQYGLEILFVIVFLEYMNLPGLPAGIIMPAAGFLVANGGQSFSLSLIISVIAGLLGSYVLYILGRYIGAPLYEWTVKRSPKAQVAMSKATSYIDKYGNRGLFITRTIPMVRTMISFLAGTLKLDIKIFTIYSTLGIIVWNFVFICAGYLIGLVFINTGLISLAL